MDLCARMNVRQAHNVLLVRQVGQCDSPACAAAGIHTRAAAAAWTVGAHVATGARDERRADAFAVAEHYQQYPEYPLQ